MASPADLAASAQVAALSVLASCVSPRDAIRLLSELATFRPNAPTSDSAIGVSQATMQSACGDVFRRAALTMLARASSVYQPASYDDAVSVRDSVTMLIDAEITVAGDQGEDATYQALRSLRQAVIADLAARGASLAPIESFELNAPLPALTLAHQLYQDAGRADELAQQANPRHPAFMPTRFKALAN